MNKEREITIDIISNCLKIDTEACNLYKKFIKISPDKSLKKFWQEMVEDEKEHIEYWRRLLKLYKNENLPPVFKNSKKIKQELDSTIIRINELLKFVNEKNSVTQNFLLAYRMEFYMLNRIFSTLFHFIKTFSDEKSPEDSYEDHIKRFIMKINQYKHDSLELELLSETISKLWYDNKHLAILTTHDPLTNLLNRNGLFNSMNILLHLAMRNNYLVGIMMIDIDFFKKINDTYGHQKGDEILVQVSRIIKENVRRSDIVGRYGGEEILVFLFNIDKNGLIKTGDKIRRSIENETRDSVPVTVSIGVSYDYIDSNPQEKVQELIKKADDNLYKAKRMGRNQVVYIKNR